MTCIQLWIANKEEQGNESKRHRINYLTYNEKGLQQLITWFLNDMMMRKWHSRQEYRNTRDRVQGEPIGMATGPDRSRPIWRTHSPETTITRDPVWNKSLRTVFPDQESTHECDHRIVPAGCINPKCWECNLTSGRQPDLSVIRFESGTRTRCEDNGVYGKTIYSHIPYLYVDASYFKVRDGVKYANKALLVVVGVGTDGYREILAARVADVEHGLTWEGLFSDLEGARSHQSGSHHLWWSYRDPICCRENVPRLLMADVPCTLHPGSSQKSPSETSQKDCWDSERIPEWCR